jgi:hypothetical protein
MIRKELHYPKGYTALLALATFVLTVLWAYGVWLTEDLLFTAAGGAGVLLFTAASAHFLYTSRSPRLVTPEESYAAPAPGGLRRARRRRR